MYYLYLQLTLSPAHTHTPPPHPHTQRLRDLKTYEAGRKFGGHRDREGEREKTRAAHQVAMERARMIARRWVL